MFASVSLAPSRTPVPDTPKPSKLAGADRMREQRQDDDELLRSLSSDDEDRKRRRAPLKPLVLDPIPHASGFRRWPLVFYGKVVAASRRDSIATMAWIQQVEKPNTNLADLEVSDKRRDDLDVALSEAVLNVVIN